MSDKSYYDGIGKKGLPSWVAKQMLVGAGWAALLVFGTWICIYVFHLIGIYVLPAESQQAPAPMPQPEAAIEMPYDATRAVV